VEKICSVVLGARERVSWAIVAFALVAMIAGVPLRATQAQMFIANEGSSEFFSNGSIGEYTLSGTPINASLITGLAAPSAICIVGSDMYVLLSGANGAGGIGEYTLTGQPVNPDLVTGLNSPAGMVIVGSDIFIGDYYNSGMSEYSLTGAPVHVPLVKNVGFPTCVAVLGSDLLLAAGSGVNEYTTSGTLVKANLFSDPQGTNALAVSGSDIFVGQDDNDTVGEYTTSGTLVNNDLVNVTGGVFLNGMTIVGSDIYVTNAITPFEPAGNTVGEYTTSGGTVNSTLISGLQYPAGLAIIVPEPVSVAMLALGGAACFMRRRRGTLPAV
jgi:hypothetical protein